MPTPNLKALLQSIDALPPKHFQKLIGIDGLGASGKTTVANQLAELHSGVTIIHTDEFYKPKHGRSPVLGVVPGQVISPDFDWDRLDAQVFQPILRGLLVKYQNYDWRADTWGDWIEIPPGSWIIIVGVYALQSRFLPYYDYTIWCELSREERIRRMTEHEGRGIAEIWQQKWLPREENYLAVDAPDKRASIVLTS